jgi:hypothetical protein
MRRRDFLPLTLLGAPNLLLAGEAIAWSPAVQGLRLGLSFKSRPPHGYLFVFLENLGTTPLDVFLALGEEYRVQFTAITLDRRELKISDAAAYRPCAGICGQPILERLYPGDTNKYTFSLEKQFYVSPKGQYTKLDVLLQGSCSMQASFEVTSQELKEAGFRLANPWLGHVITGEIRP